MFSGHNSNLRLTAEVYHRQSTSNSIKPSISIEKWHLRSSKLFNAPISNSQTAGYQPSGIHTDDQPELIHSRAAQPFLFWISLQFSTTWRMPRRLYFYATWVPFRNLSSPRTSAKPANPIHFEGRKGARTKPCILLIQPPIMTSLISPSSGSSSLVTPPASSSVSVSAMCTSSSSCSYSPSNILSTS